MVLDASEEGNEQQYNGHETQEISDEFFNILRNASPESPLHSSFRRPIDLDMYTSGIALLAKDDSRGTAQPTRVNVC